MEKENLRPEDLMVGDWVLLFDKTLVKVDCIGNVEVYLTEPRGQHELDWRVTYEHIKPIPLTQEILEKNGFKADGVFDKTEWFMYNDNVGVVKDELGKYRISIKGTLSLDINYVHELQHCLKLVGIDKEIIV